MTCVVAVTEGNHMVMMGDSAAGNQDMLNFRLASPPKVAKEGRLLYGYAGDFRMCQLAEKARLSKVKAGKVMAQRLTAARLKFGWQELRGIEGELLVCCGGRIHYFNGDGTWIEISALDRSPSLTYAAIGSGAGVATGSLYATAREKMSLAERAKGALEAAVCHHAYVRGPFFTVSI
jgi:ATP-dependent protease HslVU (ClpYQ) peptidase subunit